METQMNGQMTIIPGKRYHLKGLILNGYKNGLPQYTNEEVTRVVSYLTPEYVVCECGRKFVRNENLQAQLC